MRRARLAAALLPLALAACSFGGEADTVSFAADSAQGVALGEGDVSVTSTDGKLVLMLVGDTVRMQLSDSLRASVRAEVDSSIAGETGALGGTIARSVGKVVGSAMAFAVRIPVEDVRNVRYEDGHIRFESRGTVKVAMGEETGRHPGRSGGRFSPEDGERFVEAVKARQRERGAF